MATAVQSLVSISFLFFLVFFLVNQHRVDRLRQQLFFIRDALFDEAAAGRISFDSRAYVYTRTVLNGLLRFSHRVSFSRFFTAALLMSKSDQSESRHVVRAAMSASPEADRVVCEQYLKKAHLAMLKHLGSSPVFLMLIPVLSLILTWIYSMSLFTWALNHCKSQLLRLDIAAYAEGRSVLTTSRESTSNSRFA
ncbi:hypothetical protein [Variovorax fucosicus]|uniref:hypothetical protein n=1 Tax=Variovorax fucosicus TaxID=3053517 RepID=UPI002577E2EC|nr:hypothetical protein [Variovorax sp. J22G47]MDM0054062.1 hypothetical protein [Variovorax sp. J22G47]